MVPGVPCLVDSNFCLLDDRAFSLNASDSVSKFFSLFIKTQVIGLGPTLIHYDLILIAYSCKDPLSK